MITTMSKYIREIIIAILSVALVVSFTDCGKKLDVSDVIKKDADDTKKVVKELQDKIDALLADIAERNKEIERIRNENESLRRRKNEKINEIRNYSHDQLDRFFDERGL